MACWKWSRGNFAKAREMVVSLGGFSDSNPSGSFH
jgi:hypothetical protein